MEKYGRLKTKEELQAQVESFAEQKLEPKFTREEKSFRDVLMLNPEMFTAFYGDDDSMPDKVAYSNNQKKEIYENSAEFSKQKDFENLPKNLSDIVEKHHLEYLNFLKTESTKSREFKAMCIKRYSEEFEVVSRDIIEKINNIDKKENIKNIEGYINEGSNGYVFKIDTDSGIHAMKFYFHEDRAISIYDLEAMRRAKDVKGAAHLEAYSQKDRVMIMDFVDGKDLSDLNTEEIDNFSDNELKSLVNTVVELHNLQITYEESNINNFIYNKDQGIVFIDYQMEDSPDQFALKLKDLAKTLSLRMDSKKGDDFNERNLNTKRRILDIVKNDFPILYDKYRDDFLSY